MRFQDWVHATDQEIFQDFAGMKYMDNPPHLLPTIDGCYPNGNSDYQILAACYTYENYSGSAIVILQMNGYLYEVHGGHCSCHGLENQWQPEPVFIGELIERATRLATETDWYSGDASEFWAYVRDTASTWRFNTNESL